jgi:hypothetical protein
MTDRLKETGELIATPEALREWLSRQPEVLETIDDIRAGALTEIEVSDCVDKLTNYFQRGTNFPWDIALASLCVAIERVPGIFYEGFLKDLAAVRVLEMPISPRVAAECLKQRSSMAQTDLLTVEMSAARRKKASDKRMQVETVTEVPSKTELTTEKFSLAA